MNVTSFTLWSAVSLSPLTSAVLGDLPFYTPAAHWQLMSLGKIVSTDYYPVFVYAFIYLLLSHLFL